MLYNQIQVGYLKQLAKKWTYLFGNAFLIFLHSGTEKNHIVIIELTFTFPSQMSDFGQYMANFKYELPIKYPAAFRFHIKHLLIDN